MSGHVVALCGGVGGAKLAHGLALTLPPEELSIIVNTGDDFEHLGLHISPDLDSVLYALSGLSDLRSRAGAGAMKAGRSWARLADWAAKPGSSSATRIWPCMSSAPGDSRKARSLSDVTAHLCRARHHGARAADERRPDSHPCAHGGRMARLPGLLRAPCNARPSSRISYSTARRTRRPQPKRPRRASTARTCVRSSSAPRTRSSASSPSSRCRANAERDTRIRGAGARRHADHRWQGRSKDLAAKMLAELGLDVSGAGVARRYTHLVDAFVIDHADPAPEPIEGVTFLKAATLMSTLDDRAQLARAVLEAADSLVPSLAATRVNRTGGSSHG